MNRRKALVVVVFLLAIAVLIVYYARALDSEESVHDGQIDLTHTNFSEAGTVELNGAWEFYWGQFLEPADFADGPRQDVRYLQVPGNWRSDQEGKHYPNQGYATYRIRIENIPDTRYFGLKKANIRNASRIYVNDNLILTDGQLSERLQGSVGGNNSRVVYFELDTSTADIIVQVANHEYLTGGIAKPISFGTQDRLSIEHNQKVMFEFCMILIVLIIGLFYLFLYISNREYRKREPVTLPLAFSCFALGLMNGIYSERVITILIPEITLDATLRFGYLMSSLSVVTLMLVIQNIYAVTVPSSMRNALAVSYGVTVVLLLTLPLEVYTGSLIFFMLGTLGLFFVVWLRLLVLFLKSPVQGSNDGEHGTIIVSLFCIFLYWLDLILYSVGIKTNMLLSFLTLAVYSIAFMVLLIIRYARSYKKNEELSIQLIETFSTLDQTAKEAQRNELAFLQAQIKPHFLFNALSSIISLCYTNGERAAKLLTDLSNYLKRAFQTDLDTDEVTIENELQLIRAFVDIEKVRFGDRLDIVYEIDTEALSCRIIPLVIEPIVENAIRHGIMKNKAGGRIRLSIRKTGRNVVVCVEDNGKGIDPQRLKAIRAHETAVQNPSGNGISVANINARLRNVYGVELHFSTNDQGTIVSFTIPVERGQGEADDKSCISG